MSLRFSPSTGGFYDTDLHRRIPEDAVYVSPSRHAELMAAQGEGARIAVSPDTGNPVIDARPDNEGTRRSQLTAATRREARRRIDAVSPIWRQMNDLRNPDAAARQRFAAIDAIRAASNEIEAVIAATPAAELDAIDVAENMIWPEETA